MYSRTALALANMEDPLRMVHMTISLSIIKCKSVQCNGTLECSYKWASITATTFIAMWENVPKMSRNVRKCTFRHVRQATIQISLRIRAVWFESSLYTLRKFVSLIMQNAISDDSDQTARMRRLIWIFAGHHMPKGTFRDVPAYLDSLWYITNVAINMNNKCCSQ